MLKLMSFLKIEFGKRHEILDQLRGLPEVVKIVSVTGDYDLIVEFEVDETEQMAETFMKKVDVIPGIKDIHSNFIMKVWEK